MALEMTHPTPPETLNDLPIGVLRVHARLMGVNFYGFRKTNDGGLRLFTQTLPEGPKERERLLACIADPQHVSMDYIFIEAQHVVRKFIE